jgi:hypothetical protein
MFVGHYGVALAAKPVGFIPVQWLDVIWSILVQRGFMESLLHRSRKVSCR